MSKQQVKVLFLDVEMAPMKSYHWQLFDQNIPTNMIIERSSMLAWGAKWLGQKKIIYTDVSKQKNKRDDSKIMKRLWRLLAKADVVVSHYIAFDKKKSNSRMIINGLKPVKPYREICTHKIAKKHFKFDSNKLSDLGIVLGCDLQKYEHGKFHGNDLFIKCLEGNKDAWKEMRKYNPIDVLLLEEIYHKLIPWDNSINFNTYYEDNENRCSCGSFVCHKRGVRERKHTNAGVYARYVCLTCGKWFTGKTNLLSKIKRRDMLK